MKETNTCPECGADVGNAAHQLDSNGINFDSAKARLCFNVHCDWKQEV